MAPMNIDSFTLAGYPGNEVDNQVMEVETLGGEDRSTTPSYRIQPVVWMFVALGLAILGLWFFLEE